MYHRMGVSQPLAKGPMEIPIYNDREGRFYFVEYNQDFPLKHNIGVVNLRFRVSKQNSLEMERETKREELSFYAQALNYRPY